MSHPLKFRVWDKETQKMLSLSKAGILSIHQWPDGDAGLSYYDGQRAYNDIEVEWFTGLRDKNGEDIYERDVVTSQSYRFWHQSVVRRGDSGAYETVKGDGYCDSWIVEEWSCFEVIGNVRENPELVK